MENKINQAYIAAKNNPEILERIFKGMFIVARRVLGLSTSSSSSYPFNTMLRWTGISSFKNDAAFYERKEALSLSISEYPQSKVNKNGRGEHFCFVTMTDASEVNSNGVVNTIMTEAGLDRSSNVNTNQLAKALFADYFEDMVKFALLNKDYSKGWLNSVSQL